MSNVDTKKYLEFVNGVTSQESKDSEAFTSRLAYLYHKDFPTERLLTAAVGMSAEAGEFTDCLLYTSPSPRDLSTSRMPSSA